MRRLACTALVGFALAAGCGREPPRRRPATAPAKGARPPITTRATTQPTLTLTPERIGRLSDRQLERAVVDSVLARIGTRYDREAEIVRSLPRGARMVYATWLLEAEVGDGGFVQYFWNTAGRLAEEALAGYRLIGARQHARVLEQVLAAYRKEAPRWQSFHARGTPEALRELYDHTELGGFDEAFRGLSEDAVGLRARYIRAHREEFAGP